MVASPGTELVPEPEDAIFWRMPVSSRSGPAPGRTGCRAHRGLFGGGARSCPVACLIPAAAGSAELVSQLVPPSRPASGLTTRDGPHKTHINRSPRLEAATAAAAEGADQGGAELAEPGRLRRAGRQRCRRHRPGWPVLAGWPRRTGLRKLWAWVLPVPGRWPRTDFEGWGAVAESSLDWSSRGCCGSCGPRPRLTQEELAEAAGLSPRSVSDLERGIDRTARKDTAVCWPTRWIWPSPPARCSSRQPAAAPRPRR